VDFGTFLVQCLNSVQYGLLLFLVASGLTLIFGIMGVINLAHGSFYMIGAYMAFALAPLFGDQFLLMLVAGVVLAAIFGYLLEWAFFSYLYQRDHLQQVLMTYGLILVFEELRSILVGNDVHGVKVPAWLDGSFALGNVMSYPWYRLFASAACIVLAVGLYWVVNRTRLGMMIRAGASNRDMVRGLGIDVKRLYRIVFAAGVALAALAGNDRRADVLGVSEHGCERAHHLLRAGGDRRHRLDHRRAAGLAAGGLRRHLRQGVLRGPERHRHLSADGHRADLEARRADGEAVMKRSAFLLPVACAVLIGIAGPLMGNYASDFVVKIMILSIFALSLELFVGMTGLVSLGHAAFYGIGAYVTVLASGSEGGNFALLLPAAMGAAALYALFVGALSLRTRGVYFIMVTLAFAQMAFFVFHDTKIGGGSDGIYMYVRPAIGALDMENRTVLFYVVLASLAFTYGLLALIRRSRFGAALAGIRVNEQRMRAAGFPGVRLQARGLRAGGGARGPCRFPAGLARRRGQPRADGLAQLGRGAADGDPGRPRPPARRGDRCHCIHAAQGNLLDACRDGAARGPLATHAGHCDHRVRGVAAEGADRPREA
jgi:branched-chain amino acid transport system permease protein